MIHYCLQSGDKDSAPPSGPGYNEHGANIRVQCKNGYTLAKRADRSVHSGNIISPQNIYIKGAGMGSIDRKRSCLGR